MELISDGYSLSSLAMTAKLRKLLRLLPPLVAREIRERYTDSVLGTAWTLIQPAVFILLYWMVFSRILRVGGTPDAPFIVFLLSGLLPWFAFQEGLAQGAAAIVAKRQVIKKVMFPSELFPLVSVSAAGIVHGTGFLLFLAGFFLWKGEVKVLQAAALVALFAWQWLLTAGLALFLASLAVYLRDILQLLSLALQALFYTTTVLYPLAAVPNDLRPLLFINPFTPLAESYHRLVLYGQYPEPDHVLYLLVAAPALFALGAFLFRKLKPGFADVL